jgi:hypothetical protein
VGLVDVIGQFQQEIALGVQGRSLAEKARNVIRCGRPSLTSSSWCAWV